MTSRYAQAERLRRREQANAALMGMGSIPAARAAPPPPSRANCAAPSRARPMEPLAVRRLREKVAAKGVHGVHGLLRLLRIMDLNGDGVVTKDELRFGLEDFEVKVNRVEVDEVFEYLDKDKSGAVTQDEFLRGIRGPMSAARQRLVREAFDKLDKTFSGCVTLEDLETSYDPEHHPEVLAGRMSAAEALRDFVKQWDAGEPTDEVSFEQFLEYHKNAGVAFASDAGFEDLVRGTWRMPRDEPHSPDPAAADPVTTNPAIEAAQGGRPEHEGVAFPTVGLDDQRSMYVSTAAMAQQNAELPTKRAVPRWIRFDGEHLCFSLFREEQLDPNMRTFDNPEGACKMVRTFVLKYFLEDGSATVTESTGPPWPKMFLKRSALDGVSLADLRVGGTVKLQGLPMQVFDADNKARRYFKENFPSIRNPAGPLPLPALERSKPKPKARESFGRKAPESERAEWRATTSQKFIAEAGKVLQFGCAWKDPGPPAQQRFFTLYYYLGDDTIELRELLARNSGRDVRSRFNLHRGQLMNPSTHAPYVPADLRLGGALRVYGRDMQLVSCDAFTRHYYQHLGVAGFEDEEPAKQQQEQHTPRFGRVASQETAAAAVENSWKGEQAPAHPSRRRLPEPGSETVVFRWEQHGAGGQDPRSGYQDAGAQKYDQIVHAIRATLEQRSHFATLGSQARMLDAYLKRFRLTDAQLGGGGSGGGGGAMRGEQPDFVHEDALEQDGFFRAMAGFSCFGADAELVFERHADKAGLVPIASVVEQVYPGLARASESTTCQDRAQLGAAPYSTTGPGGRDADPARAAAPTGRSVAQPKLSSQGQSLANALRSKLEVRSHFDERKQQAELWRMLSRAARGRAAISEAELKSALAPLNCGGGDASLLFRDLDKEGAGTVKLEAVQWSILQKP